MRLPLRRLPPLLLLWFLAGLPPSAHCEVSCAPVFSDHMVLQRDRPLPVWGDAAPGEQVTVEFGGQRKRARATTAGRWQVTLDAEPASREPRTLTIRASNVVNLSDVVVGEVWLCSGQSNMEKPLGPRTGQKPTDGYEAALRQADHPLVRLFQMPQFGRLKKGQTGLRWLPCAPETLQRTQFSAVAYYFGWELQRQLEVPIGLIHSSFGGTRIEAWMPAVAFERDPALRGLLGVKYDAYVPGVQATELYTSMIAPFVPFALRGFLWYQGEANCMCAEGAIYAEKMRALIAAWRRAWSDGSAPFYYVQLAPFDYSRWDKFPRRCSAEELPLFRDAQTQVLDVPQTGMVVTTDLVTNPHDIHPTDKRDVGLRLAGLALERTYGRASLVAESPQFEFLRIRGPQIELHFLHAGSGLGWREGPRAGDFLIAGSDRRFVPAEATIRGNTVTVSAAVVPAPEAVRFGWNEVAMPHLVNSAGLPAIPFRTDDWPVAAERPAP